MAEITRVEPAKRPIPKRLRVAAYARVSSGKDAMLHSLSAQVSFYSGYIQRHGEWEYAGVYADEAETGTKDNRPAFQRMLADCRAGLIDVIITKSVTRFARNTVTMLETVRELRLLGIDVFFEKENIHSNSGDGELMLTVLASFAQEESRSVSENCKWRIRKDFQQGRPNAGRMLGYRLVNGVLTVVPEEAEIVRRIFDDYLSGMGVNKIMRKYRALGVHYSKNGIAQLLRNEKYQGDMLLQKTFVTDHITKRKAINTGQLPRFYVTDSHEPILSKDVFAAVQAEIDRRASRMNREQRTINNKTSYPFTGMIRCDQCGAAYRRKRAAAGTKYEKIVWICSTFNTLGKSECASQQIPEDILWEKVNEAGGLERISEIRVPGKNRLIFAFRDGSTQEIEWQHRSRSESWTDEMRQQMRAADLRRRGGAAI